MSSSHHLRDRERIRFGIAAQAGQIDGQIDLSSAERILELIKTETELDTVTGWDAVLVNNGSVDDLEAQLDRLLGN